MRTRKELDKLMEAYATIAESVLPTKKLKKMDEARGMYPTDEEYLQMVKDVTAAGINVFTDDNENFWPTAKSIIRAINSKNFEALDLAQRLDTETGRRSMGGDDEVLGEVAEAIPARTAAAIRELIRTCPPQYKHAKRLLKSVQYFVSED